MRAAIYIRVSTEEQALHGYSLADQAEACRTRAEELGATIINEYFDEGITGSTLDRPGLEKLRNNIKQGLIDTVIILDPDRFSRKLSHQLLLTEEFENAGVTLVFINFEWIDSPEGRMFYSIKGAVSEYEREKIKERMIRGKNQKAKQGGMPVNFCLFGYNYDAQNGVRINQKEAEVVKYIYHALTKDNMSPAAIAIHLTESGIPTKRGKPFWYRQTVRQILLNPAYYGEWPYRRNTDKPIIIPVPPIVDKETWDKTQEVLKESKRLWAKRGKQDYLLSGIVTCLDCGTPMGGAFKNNWGKKVRYYTCTKSPSTNRISGCIPIKSINADSLEYNVWEKVKKLLQNPDEILMEARNNLPIQEGLTNELENINGRLQSIDKGRKSLVDALASGSLDLDEDINGKLQYLKKQRLFLINRKIEIEKTLQVSNNSGQIFAELYQVSKSIADGLDDIDFDSKQSIIRSLISQVLVTGRINTTNHKIDELPGVKVTLSLNLNPQSIPAISD